MVELGAAQGFEVISVSREFCAKEDLEQADAAAVVGEGLVVVYELLDLFNVGLNEVLWLVDPI